eukprot:7925322-Pyramimonas_sp.AAC.1
MVVFFGQLSARASVGIQTQTLFVVPAHPCCEFRVCLPTSEFFMLFGRGRAWFSLGARKSAKWAFERAPGAFSAI